MGCGCGGCRRGGTPPCPTSGSSATCTTAVGPACATRRTSSGWTPRPWSPGTRARGAGSSTSLFWGTPATTRRSSTTSSSSPSSVTTATAGRRCGGRPRRCGASRGGGRRSAPSPARSWRGRSRAAGTRASLPPRRAGHAAGGARVTSLSLGPPCPTTATSLSRCSSMLSLFPAAATAPLPSTAGSCRSSICSLGKSPSTRRRGRCSRMSGPLGGCARSAPTRGTTAAWVRFFARWRRSPTSPSTCPGRVEPGAVRTARQRRFHSNHQGRRTQSVSGAMLSVRQ
mmetsp:Transcript_91993/g.274535  ORF Transcript_91993/g.274535 Transcript_91993/m.274535 type:complete len:284 (-) Transcript_91993:25-876(-)